MPSHDAIVIGAGLVGSAIALRLAQEGLRVALLEKNMSGREASWAGAGMLSPAPDTPASIPLVPFGRASLSLYPQFIAEIEEISGRRTGYRSGVVFGYACVPNPDRTWPLYRRTNREWNHLRGAARNCCSGCFFQPPRRHGSAFGHAPDSRTDGRPRVCAAHSARHPLPTRLH